MTRQFLLLALLRSAKLGLAVASLVLYGRLFGVGLEMDAWVFASGVVAAAGMLAWGPVNEISRSRFLQHAAREGFQLAAAGATQLMRFTALGTVVLAAVLWACGPWLLDVLYAGASPDGRMIVLRVFALMLPSLVLGQLLALGSAFLNCCDAIYAPEWIGIGAAFAGLLVALLLAPRIGVYALVVAHYLGLLLSVACVLLLLARKRFLAAPWRPMAGPPVRDYLSFSAPLFLSYGAGQANGLWEKALASYLGVGILSSVNYASQIKSTLQSVITSVLFSLAVPRLTQAAAQPHAGNFSAAWQQVQRVAALFLLAVLPPVWGLADLIAAVLFGKAGVGPGPLQLVSGLIRLYCAALVPVTLYLVHGAALLARQRGRAYAFWGVVAQVLSALLSLALFHPLGAYVFPVALVASHTVAAVAMAKAVGPSRTLWVEFAAWLAAIVLSCCIVTVVAGGARELVRSDVWALLMTAALYGAGLAVAAAWHRRRKGSLQ